MNEKNKKTVLLVIIGLLLIMLFAEIIYLISDKDEKQEKITTTTTRTTAANHEMSDSLSGIKLNYKESNEIKLNSKLEVEKIEIKTNIENVISVYEIDIVDENNNKVNVNNTNLFISIPFESVDKYKSIKILYLNNINEIKETFIPNVNENNIEFNTTHLNKFAIVGELIDNTISTTTTRKITTKTTKKVTTTTKTTQKNTNVIKDYKITFESNGGSSVESQIVREGDKVTMPSQPTRKGYIFDGWYLNEKKFDFETKVNQNITLKAKWKGYEKYTSDSLSFQCYTKESVDANNFETATNVSKGDKIVCFVGFETYSYDKVKEIEFNLKYGSGLRLIDFEPYENSYYDNGGYYQFDYNGLNAPTSVGDLGEYVFEVVNVKNENDINININNIKFITSDNNHYYTNDENVKLKTIWNVDTSKYQYYSFNPIYLKCYTKESVDNNNWELVTDVSYGDKIVCDVSSETYAKDKVKHLKYTLNYFGLKYIGKEGFYDAVVNNNQYVYEFSTPDSVNDLGYYIFEVTTHNDVMVSLEKIQFITTNKDYYYTSVVSATY